MVVGELVESQYGEQMSAFEIHREAMVHQELVEHLGELKNHNVGNICTMSLQDVHQEVVEVEGIHVKDDSPS